MNRIRKLLAKILGIKPGMEIRYVENQVEVIRFVPQGAKPLPLYKLCRPGNYGTNCYGYTDNINLAMEWSNKYYSNYSSVVSCWRLDGEWFIPAHSKRIEIINKLPE